MHHVDYIFAQVLGVIADTLQSARNQQRVERTADGARVFHHEGDALALYRLIFFVYRAILLRDTHGSLGVQPGVGIERGVQQVLYHASEVLEFPIFVGRPLLRGESRAYVTDLLAFVADTFEIGDRLDDRQHHAQIAGRRRAGRENALAFLVDRHFHRVDLEIVASDRLT